VPEALKPRKIQVSAASARPVLSQAAA
jgi:hypothetical protein